jgi:hypothetical protein
LIKFRSAVLESVGGGKVEVEGVGTGLALGYVLFAYFDVLFKFAVLDDMRAFFTLRYKRTGDRHLSTYFIQVFYHFMVP